MIGDKDTIALDLDTLSWRWLPENTLKMLLTYLGMILNFYLHCMESSPSVFCDFHGLSDPV